MFSLGFLSKGQWTYGPTLCIAIDTHKQFQSQVASLHLCPTVMEMCSLSGPDHVAEVQVLLKMEATRLGLDRKLVKVKSLEYYSEVIYYP